MTKRILFLTLLAGLLPLPAIAELQNVEIGGKLQIRGNWYTNYLASPDGARLRWPGNWLAGRAIGSSDGSIWSAFSWDKDSNSSRDVNQRTRLSAKADFTGEVTGLIEFDSYDTWGEDFRSNHITGADFRQNSAADDVSVYQAYIEARELGGLPLTLKVGRQEVLLGSGWLIGTNDTGSIFTGLSFDAVALVYAQDPVQIVGFWAKGYDGGLAEEDGDVDLYGVYGTYTGLENQAFDAYWILGRDARSVNDTNFSWVGETVEGFLGLDDYNVTNLHTVGLRGSGKIGAFDYEAEAAYQFGDASQEGSLFKLGFYGDDDASFDALGANLELGYTFDTAWSPRLFLGGAYFSGEDNRSTSFWDQFNPFREPKASVSFDRLFSNWGYSEFLDFTELSNIYVLRSGVVAKPTEALTLKLLLSYFNTVEPFEAPVTFNLGGYQIPIAPGLGWWTKENPSDLGWEAEVIANYQYTEDLSFEVGWAHLFVGDGLASGAFNSNNGLAFTGGSGSDDSDYLYAETKLKF